MMDNFKKSAIRIWAVALALIISAGANISLASEPPETSEPSEGSAGTAVEIWDAEGLRAIAEDPAGTYILAADIDMSGEAWTPFAFHGSLDGGGYSVLNLTIKKIGAAVRETYDGNMKVYDTYFAGLFDEMEDAQVRGLNLVNLRIDVETDLPCFIGGIAGYMENSLIEDCTVQGILQLKAHDRMFGVGGIVGFGCGDVKNTNADVTLVCTDTDASTRDEQFMGGICAAGYPNINGCSVAISGFDSDHGYVHNGGLIGMYMFYPRGVQYKGSITDNNVTGKITFFEDNTNRRAYCSAFVGEFMSWNLENDRNKSDFVRDEIFTYNVDLVPHACEDPVLRPEVTAPGCEFGYMTYVCETCGYRETDHYTLKAHDYEWTILKDASVAEEGLREGVCKLCGQTARENIPTLEPEQAADSASENVGGLTDGSSAGGGSGDASENNANGGPFTAALAAVVILAAAGTVWVVRTRKK